MKKVQILLSTYNGEKYIREQLDSLINQDYENINILIRDDGSTDSTVSIIESYAIENSSITLTKGNNIGVVASFFELIKNADLSADLFSFCDQDDVWHKNKISKAVEKISDCDEEKPILYFSRLTMTDDNLNIIKDTKISKYVGSYNAVVQNIVTGCTIVINKRLLLLSLNNFPNTNNVYMHDWWLYLWASFFGQIIFDYNSYILYRQHDNNTMGLPLSFWQVKKRQIKYMLNRKGRTLRIAHINEFWSLSKDKLSPEQKKLILSFFDCQKGFIKRYKVSFKMPFRFQSELSTWKLRLLIIFNLY